jgi:hypothetical protein
VREEEGARQRHCWQRKRARAGLKKGALGQICKGEQGRTASIISEKRGCTTSRKRAKTGQAKSAEKGRK